MGGGIGSGWSGRGGAGRGGNRGRTTGLRGSGEEGQVVLIIGWRGGRRRWPDLAFGTGGGVEGERGGGN